MIRTQASNTALSQKLRLTCEIWLHFRKTSTTYLFDDYCVKECGLAYRAFGREGGQERYICTIMCFNIKPLAVLFWLLSGYTTVSVKSKGSRQYNTEEFLKQQGYSYLVGLTGSESVANWCVRSHFQGTSEKGIEIYHQLKYVPQKVPEESDNAKADETQKDLPENQDSDNPQADEAQKEIYYEQHPKEHALILIVENDNKGIHVALRENDNTKSPKQDHFDVVYASYECLIIALKQTKGIYLKDGNLDAAV
ncbi:hypothetical protein MRX96_034952 [Rhipicephalus microplus]